MKECPDQNGQGINFAHEDFRKKWELLEKARALSDTIPFDDPLAEDIRPIHFDYDNRESGLLIAIVCGPTSFTKEKEVILVPSRTRVFLDKLEIPYNEGFPRKGLDLSELTQRDF